MNPTIFISLAALILITGIILVQQGAARALFAIGAMFMALSSAWQAAREKYRVRYAEAMEHAPAPSREMGRAR